MGRNRSTRCFSWLVGLPVLIGAITECAQCRGAAVAHYTPSQFAHLFSHLLVTNEQSKQAAGREAASEAAQIAICQILFGALRSIRGFLAGASSEELF